MGKSTVVQAPGEALVYRKCKEYGACVVYIENKMAVSTQLRTKKAQIILNDSAYVVGTYDEKVKLADLREDIKFALCEMERTA